jgi:hypothetical protein
MEYFTFLSPTYSLEDRVFVSIIAFSKHFNHCIFSIILIFME